MWVRVASAMSLVLLFTGAGWAQSACLTLAITNVEYAGIEGINRKDKVRVNISQSPSCLRPVKIRTEVSVTRPGGHVDSGFDETVINPMPPSFYHDVLVERGALERDPISYSATVKLIQFVPLKSPSTTADSTGATISRSSDQNSCCPKVDILSIRPRTNAADVSWSVTHGSASCFQTTGASLSIKVIHTNGACSGQQTITSPSTTQATVSATCPSELPEALGAVTKVEATVTAILAAKSGFVVQAQKSGNF